MDISVIIVNFRSEPYLLDCINSLRQNLGTNNYEIIIVNNDASQLESASCLNLANLTILNGRCNEGFSTACNAGAAIAKGKILFFLNPDTKIISNNFEILFNLLSNDSAGIAAPTLILSSGELQPWSYGKAVNPWTTILNNLPFLQNKCPQPTEIAQVDWVSGAAMAITKKTFDKLAGFDENFFMYFEDIDLCRRAKLLGCKIVNVPGIAVLHIGGKSYNNLHQQKADYYRSQDYYFQKHFGALATLGLKILRCLRFTKNS